MSQYPCDLSESGLCQHGGSRRFNYGFYRGTAGYCRKVKKWTRHLDECPTKAAAEAAKDGGV